MRSSDSDNVLTTYLLLIIPEQAQRCTQVNFNWLQIVPCREQHQSEGSRRVYLEPQHTSDV